MSADEPCSSRSPLIPLRSGQHNRCAKPFPWETAPGYLLRERDRIFGRKFVEQLEAIGIEKVLSAPRCPSQRAYVERAIGIIPRECLDHLIAFNEQSLHRHIQEFLNYIIAIARNCD